MKIKKGDKVKILLGKDRGKIVTVGRVFEKEKTLLLDGVNIFKKHSKPRGQGESSQGGIISVSRPMTVSRVALVCPKCNKETRVGFLVSGKEKTRICVKCEAQI